MNKKASALTAIDKPQNTHNQKLHFVTNDIQNVYSFWIDMYWILNPKEKKYLLLKVVN